MADAAGDSRYEDDFEEGSDHPSEQSVEMEEESISSAASSPRKQSFGEVPKKSAVGDNVGPAFGRRAGSAGVRPTQESFGSAGGDASKDAQQGYSMSFEAASSVEAEKSARDGESSSSQLLESVEGPEGRKAANVEREPTNQRDYSASFESEGPGSADADVDQNLSSVMGSAIGAAIGQAIDAAAGSPTRPRQHAAAEAEPDEVDDILAMFDSPVSPKASVGDVAAAVGGPGQAARTAETESSSSARAAQRGLSTGSDSGSSKNDSLPGAGVVGTASGGRTAGGVPAVADADLGEAPSIVQEVLEQGDLPLVQQALLSMQSPVVRQGAQGVSHVLPRERDASSQPAVLEHALGQGAREGKDGVESTGHDPVPGRNSDVLGRDVGSASGRKGGLSVSRPWRTQDKTPAKSSRGPPAAQHPNVRAGGGVEGQGGWGVGGAVDIHDVAGRLRRGEGLGEDEATWFDLLHGPCLRPVTQSLGASPPSAPAGTADDRGNVAAAATATTGPAAGAESYERLPPPVRHRQVWRANAIKLGHIFGEAPAVAPMPAVEIAGAEGVTSPGIRGVGEQLESEICALILFALVSGLADQPLADKPLVCDCCCDLPAAVLLRLYLTAAMRGCGCT